MAQTSNSLASFKDRLSRIAHEVRDAAEELEIPQSLGSAAEDSPPYGRRSTHRSSRSPTPIANGAEPGYPDEIAKYKADIQKLQASEAEIKALSFNYAAILKEKEEHLSKLREENGSLRKNLEAKSAVGHESRDESQKRSPNSFNALKGTADLSPARPSRHTSQVNSRSTGNHALKGNNRQNEFSNGGVQAIQYDTIQRKMELKSGSQGNGTDHTDMLEENHRSLLAVQASLESEIKQLKVQLDNERENVRSTKQRLQEEQRLNESSQREFHSLKTDKELISVEMQELQKELNEKMLGLQKLQAELNRRNMEETSHSLENMKNTITNLEKENAKLKIEKDELEASLKLSMKNTPENLDSDDLDYPNRDSSKSNEIIEEMSLSIRQLEDALKNTCKERDKALQEVARLRQHLLEKELADADKMDEDSKTIDELKASSEYQRAQILQLEKALRQEVAKKEEVKKLDSDEIRRLSEVIDGLNKKLRDSVRTVDAKNVELLNLQTALGQYYAEIEAKEHLGQDLAMAREESAKLSQSLKVANQGMETLKREKEDIAAKLSQAERMLSEGKLSIQKLEDDNSKLRRALERSMTTLNRMSLDSDNFVDRRIVIKLLVTYFQRNHSKEVLDLMVRMLGFSEEDKQRIGFAQHAAGKGVVRGVLGLPGRLVGGILGGTSPEAASHLPSENQNQSFADLWVDFLVKETEERERRESSEAARTSSSSQDKNTDTRVSSVLDHRPHLPSTSGFPNADLFANQAPSLHAKQNHIFEHSDSEFSTVPLTSLHSSSESSSSKLPPRY